MTLAVPAGQRRLVFASVLCLNVVCAQPPGAGQVLPGLQDRHLSRQTAPMKTDQRIQAYQKIAQQQPGNPHWQTLLATAYIQKMRETTDFSYLDRASEIIDRILSKDGGNSEALRLRTQVELERHNFRKAAEYSEEMTKLAPGDPWNWGTWGDALVHLGNYEQAATAYQKMLALRPDLFSYNRMAYLRFVRGDATGAIAFMRAAIEGGSSSVENTAWCLVDLGNMYFKTGQIAEAESAYRSAQEAFPGYHPALAGLARIYAAQGKLQQAIETYRRAAAAVPLIEYAAALFDLYSRTGQREEARKQQQLIDVVNDLAKANGEKTNRALALIYADQDRNLDRALELAQAELQVRKDIYTYDALGWALFKNKRYEEAEQAIQQALSLGTPEPSFYYHAGMILNALGKRAEATRHLRRALELNPRFDIRQAEIAESALRQTSSGFEDVTSDRAPGRAGSSLTTRLS